ncbi:hypothetical protein ACTJIJ_23045 [Niabella sp. 22666]|uniref:hypothetical protein n=1 Tax=Niabella sp. 22666 TaxID=3453954 RepID=UPI003F857F54
MPIKTDSELKGAFAAGKIPSAQDFGNMVDTFSGKIKTLEGGFKVLMSTDDMLKPTQNAIFIAGEGNVTFNNLKKANDTVQNPGLFVSAAEVAADGLYDRTELRYIRQADIWIKVPIKKVVDSYARNIVKTNKIDGAELIWKTGYYLQPNGVEAAYAPFSYTETYIPVLANQLYTLKCSGYALVWYDEDLTVVGASGDGADPEAVRTFSSPETAKYVRCNISNTLLPDFALYEGSTLGTRVKVDGLIENLQFDHYFKSAVKTNIVATYDVIDWKNGFILGGNGQEVEVPEYSISMNYILIKPSTNYTLRCRSIAITWYDADYRFIEQVGGVFGTIDSRTYESPANAKYVRFNFQTVDIENFLIVEGVDWQPSVVIPSLQDVSDWNGKKIVWYGTSIPAGYPFQGNPSVYSYANRAVTELGATFIPVAGPNYCVPNGVIRRRKANGDVMPGRDTLSFTNTASAINYQNAMLDLLGTPDEPDLFVFDYSVNDMDADPTDINGAHDFTNENVNTFLGAYNFVLKQLFTAKKTARVLLLTHFSDDGVQGGTAFNSKNCWKPVNDLIVEIGMYWGIPVLEVRQFTNWFNTNGIENISDACPDLIHPATDPTLKSVETLKNIVKGKLKSL